MQDFRGSFICGATLAFCLAFFFIGLNPVYAKRDIHKVKHIIIIMQENHSFDNYFGALAYDTKGNPYNNGPCSQDDHTCVDGLSSCAQDGSGNITCSNSNPDVDDSTGNAVLAFHNANYCVRPDPDHSWVGSHKEANFSNPSDTLFSPTPNDGFVNVNDKTGFQVDNGVESATEDETRMPPRVLISETRYRCNFFRFRTF